MKISPAAGPGATKTINTSTTSAAREAAIATLLGNKISESEPEVTAQPAPVEARVPVAQLEPQGEEQTLQAAQDTSDQLAPQEEPATIPDRQQRDPVSRRLVALAKREKALRIQAQQQARELKAKEAAIAEKEKQIQARQQQYETSYIPKDALKQNPMKVLTEAGLTYDDLTQYVLNQQSMNPVVESTISELRQELQALKQQNEEFKQSQQQAQTAQYQAAVKQIKTDANQLVKTDPNFELIRATRSVNDVVELITRTYEKEGILLSVEEAAEEVEKYLEQETEKLTKTNKLRRKLSQTSQGQPVKQTQSRQQTQSPAQGPKTLTNRMTSTRQLSARERAIMAAKGEI